MIEIFIDMLIRDLLKILKLQTKIFKDKYY